MLFLIYFFLNMFLQKIYILNISDCSNWKPGQAFDTSILDNVTRESVEATLVQNGNRLVRNSIDVSV